MRTAERKVFAQPEVVGPYCKWPRAKQPSKAKRYVVV